MFISDNPAFEEAIRESKINGIEIDVDRINKAYLDLAKESSDRHEKNVHQLISG